MLLRRFHGPLVLFIGSLLAVPSAQGRVWVVDDDGGAGVDFVTIQEAITAASDGDTILLKEGTYFETPQFGSKGLVLAADASTRPIVELGGGTDASGELPRIAEGLPLGASLTIRGIEIGFLANSFSAAHTFYLRDCQGSVWIEDCSIGQIETTDSPQQAAVYLQDCDRVALLDCQVTALDGENLLVSCPAECTFGAQDAMHLVRSTAFLFDTRVEGGDGSNCYVLPSGAFGGDDGNIGILADDASSLHLEAGMVTGGYFGGCPAGGATDGGNAVELRDSSFVSTREAVLVGGGVNTFGCGDFPNPGLPLAIDGTSAAEDYPVPTLALTVDSPVRAGEIVTVHLDGPPLVPVWLAAGAQPFGLHLERFAGTVLLAPPLGISSLGSLDAGGQLTLSIPAGSVPPGVDAVAVHAQVYYFDATTSTFALGGGSFLLGLSAAF